MTIRESQAGILFYKGKARDAFGAGRHTLKTGKPSNFNKNSFYSLAGRQSASCRGLYCQPQILYKPAMGNTKSGGFQRFRTGIDQAEGARDIQYTNRSASAFHKLPCRDNGKDNHRGHSYLSQTGNCLKT